MARLDSNDVKPTKPSHLFLEWRWHRRVIFTQDIGLRASVFTLHALRPCIDALCSLFLVQMSPCVIGFLGGEVGKEDRFSCVLEVRNTILSQDQSDKLESTHCTRSLLTLQTW